MNDKYMGVANRLFMLGFQIVSAFIVLFSVYMLFTLFDSEYGLVGVIGLMLIQPIFAVIFSGLTIALCLLIGLPIRLNKKINQWWKSKSYIPIMGTISGLIMLVLSVSPGFEETVVLCVGEDEELRQIPNSVLVYIGWFLTSFSLLHLYFPTAWYDGMKRWLSA